MTIPSQDCCYPGPPGTQGQKRRSGQALLTLSYWRSPEKDSGAPLPFQHPGLEHSRTVHKGRGAEKHNCACVQGQQQ